MTLIFYLKIRIRLDRSEFWERCLISMNSPKLSIVLPDQNIIQKRNVLSGDRNREKKRSCFIFFFVS